MSKAIDKQLEIYNYMRKLDFFSSLDKNALWPLANLTTLQHYQPGEILIKEHDKPSGIFIILKGKVEVLRTLEQNREFIITELGPGQILGEISVIDKLPTTASVRALEEVDCIFISAWDFNAQIHAYPEIGLQLLPVLTGRLRIMHEKIK
jgi:CRP/FNR family cyclic AMP-dependent transcriptional regulator